MNVSSAFFTRSQLCFLLFFIILFLFQVSAVWATCELCMLLKYKSFATSFLGLLNYVSFFVFVYTEYCQTYMWNVDGYMWRFFCLLFDDFFFKKKLLLLFVTLCASFLRYIYSVGALKTIPMSYFTFNQRHLYTQTLLHPSTHVKEKGRII